MDHGKVTPLHIHPDSDETMIVLEGEILMHLDGAEHTVGAGGVASAPRGVPARVQGLRRRRRPAAVPAHARAAARPSTGTPANPSPTDDDRGIGDGPVDMGRVQASAEQNGGIEILGPPPFSHIAPN